jgi:N6-adenosine-specific RNA methylase IME4
LTLRDKHTGRLARWALWLTGFDTQVVYRTGTSNVAGDALSRAHSPTGQPIVGKLTELIRGDPCSVATTTLVDQPTRIDDVVTQQLVWAQVAGARYDVLVADPPWLYRHNDNFGQSRMNANALAKLPVSPLLSSEAAIVFMWATGPKVEEAHKVLNSWGLRVAAVAFVVIRPANTVSPGRYTQAQSEMVVVGTRGKARSLLRHTYDSPVQQVINLSEQEGQEMARTPRRLPTKFWQAMEKLLRPELRCMALFASMDQQRPEWTNFGSSP